MEGLVRQRFVLTSITQVRVTHHVSAVKRGRPRGSLSSNAQSSQSQYFFLGRLNGWFIPSHSCVSNLITIIIGDQNSHDAELPFHGTARGRIPTDSSRFFPMSVQRYPSQANTAHKLGLDRQASWRYDNIQTFVLRRRMLYTPAVPPNDNLPSRIWLLQGQAHKPRSTNDFHFIDRAGCIASS
jgi:hypothetical protein